MKKLFLKNKSFFNKIYGFIIFSSLNILTILYFIIYNNINWKKKKTKLEKKEKKNIKKVI